MDPLAGISEVKAAATADNHILLKVSDEAVGQTEFRLKRGTQLGKLMRSYCQRQGINPGSIRFLFDGHRITETDTADSLEMEDGDLIDVTREQLGGGGGGEVH